MDADLDEKRKRMAKSPFTLLRASAFRWARKIEAICPELADAPQVLSVGDAHLENFGTWRDAEGRLVWGVNDFDEAAVTPYPFDLVRLCASARLAPGLTIAPEAAAEAVLAGYRRALKQPGPIILDGHASMADFADADGDGRASTQVYDCGVGDRLRRVTQVTVRRAAEGGFEVKADTECNVRVAGQALVTLRPRREWQPLR